MACEEQNFFDKFWKPYLEFEANLGFGLAQIREEIRFLDLQPGERVANIGINWGHSLQYILEACPDVAGVVGIDSSQKMMELARTVFSENDFYLNEWLVGLAPKARKYLTNLHEVAKANADKVSFHFAPAESINSFETQFDKIAATMGYHWLNDPKEDSFVSMNKSLRLGGQVVFSTASAFFECERGNYSFTLNPYYQSFFSVLERLYSSSVIGGKELRDKELDSEEKKTGKFTLDGVVKTIQRAGFNLEHYHEHKMHINTEQIDTYCIAGVKFRYDSDGGDKVMKQLVDETLKIAKSRFIYDHHPQQYEICPIFRIKKVKEV